MENELVFNGYFSIENFDSSPYKINTLFKDGDIFAYPISQLMVYSGYTKDREIIRTVRLMNGEYAEHNLVMPYAKGDMKNPQIHTEFDKDSVKNKSWLNDEFKGLYTIIEVKIENGQLRFFDKIKDEEVFLPFNRNSVDNIEERRKKAVKNEEVFISKLCMTKIDNNFNEYLSMYDKNDYFKKSKEYLDFFDERKRKLMYDSLKEMFERNENKEKLTNQENRQSTL